MKWFHRFSSEGVFYPPISPKVQVCLECRRRAGFVLWRRFSELSPGKSGGWRVHFHQTEFARKPAIAWNHSESCFRG